MKGIENAQFDLMAYVQQKYQKAVWGAVEHILRNHIDNPIEGELTREKIKEAGIRSVFFSEEPPNLEFEKCDEKEVSCKLTSNLIGVAQGRWMIYYNGARRLLTDKEETYLAAQEQQERFAESEVINVKVLHLVLKKKWYEMQERCEKTEEYREITPYWVKRIVWDEDFDEPVSDEDVWFICSRPENIFDAGWKPKPYTHVCFHYGYTQRCFISRIDSITTGRGHPEWGAPTDRDVFIIKHHREPSPFVVGKADSKPETQNR